MLGLLSGVSIACCFVLITLPISLGIKLAIIALIIVSSMFFIMRDALLLLPWSWQSLEINSKGELSMTNKRGQQLQPALAGSTFIHTKLTILNFKRERFKWALPPAIFIENLGSNLDLEEVRRLRVWLRWAKQHHLEIQDDLVADKD